MTRKTPCSECGRPALAVYCCDGKSCPCNGQPEEALCRSCLGEYVDDFSHDGGVE